MRNKRGQLSVMAILTIAFISGSITLGVYKTKENGVLKNNGKIIWCKMQNKGAEYCDAKYLPFPEE